MQPYIEIIEAEDYFLTRLNSDPWDDASEADKYKALCTATRLIDNLHFAGIKLISNQEREFPRYGQSEVPADIKEATCELALKLLDNVDPNYEVAALASSDYSFASVRSNSDRSFVLDHIRAGIPSVEAWNKLLKYLVDPASIKIRRI